MQTVREFKKKIKFLLTDIDDTMTDEGRLGPQAYSALWKLSEKGIHVIPVTGRPAGWCEMIARMWPVAGVVGENGAFYFRYHQQKMHRHFAVDEKTRVANREKLNKLQQEILTNIKGSAIASDQFCRVADLAIDFCEDVPKLPKESVKQIVDQFKNAGAQAKVSSIHVNGWFGSYDKLTQSLNFLEKEFSLNTKQIQESCAFVGDSPNDEPMWAHFENSFAVANISEFLNDIKAKPKYVSTARGGSGFAEIAEKLIQLS